MWLEAMNLRLNDPSRKLAPKRQAYQLCLPPTWKIHVVFHASLLSSYTETEMHGPNFSKQLLDLIGTEKEYKVEQIISHQGSSGQ